MITSLALSPDIPNLVIIQYDMLIQLFSLAINEIKEQNINEDKEIDLNFCHQRYYFHYLFPSIYLFIYIWMLMNFVHINFSVKLFEELLGIFLIMGETVLVEVRLYLNNFFDDSDIINNNISYFVDT